MRIPIAIIFVLMTLAVPAHAQEPIKITTIPLNSAAHGFKLSPDGRTVAVHEIGAIHNDVVLADYLPIRLYDIGTGDLLAELEGHSDYALDVAFSPDSTRLVSIHFSGTIHVWDVPSGKAVKRIDGIPGGVRVQFHPDGASVVVLYTLPYQPYFLTWEIETESVTHVLSQRYASRQVFQATIDAQPIPDSLVAFDVLPDGSSLVMAFATGKIARWDIDSGNETVLRPSTNERPNFSIRRIKLDAAGQQIMFYDRETEQILAIDAQSGDEIVAVPGASDYFAILPDNETLVQLVQDEELNTRLEMTSLTDQSRVQSLAIDLPLSSKRPVGSFGALDLAGESIIIGGLPSPDAPEENGLLIIPL